MDRLIYIAMSGAQQLLQHQAAATHNLANVTTAGYKADTHAFRVAPVQGPGLPTRAYAVDTTSGADLAAGVIEPTGRDLDVAIQGDGMLAVQGRNGTEAYTRSGSLSINAEGQLTTRAGLLVLGDGGPIAIPPDSHISIARDGTVSASATGPGSAVTVVGNLKLVNPERGDLVKGVDGLFRTKGGGPANADPGVALVAGALESSNVNAVGAMVDMINLARAFDLQMKLLQSVDSNAQRAAQLLAANPA